MARFRKRPVVIEAMQWDGESFDEMFDWLGEADVFGHGDELVIVTLEGEMRASPGDWIIRGVQGELYPCKPDIFEATYESVDEKAEPKRPLQFPSVWFDPPLSASTSTINWKPKGTA